MKVIERREYVLPVVMRRNCEHCASLLEFGREEVQQKRFDDGSIGVSILCPVCLLTCSWMLPR